jgi:nitric oxide dioxygenase
MLRRTKAAARTSGLTVEALAHDDAEGMRGPRCGWLRVKLVAPTSQAAALFYGRLFEIAPAVKPLLRGDMTEGDMTEQGCKLMATLGVVVNSLGNLEAVLPAASALAKRHVDYGVKAADYTPVGAALLWTLEQNLGLR